MSIPFISKTRKFISTLLTFGIPIKSYRRAFRGIIQLGVIKYIRIIKTDKKTHFPQELAIGAIMKNEGPYLKEWLEFHILVGVKKFYLYDNESTDDTKEILKPYIKKGIVEYTYYPGKAMQFPAYTDCVHKHAFDTRWLALIDLDEFIVPIKHKTIIDVLHAMPQNFAQMVLTWVQYGSSGHKTKPKGLVIENYKYHILKTYGVKSIINPRLFLECSNPHANFVAGWTIDNNGKKLGYIDQTKNPPSYNNLRINHYVTKSYEEYISRMNKGSPTNQRISEYRSLEKFKLYDKNEVYDPIMDKYIPILHKKLGIK